MSSEGSSEGSEDELTGIEMDDEVVVPDTMGGTGEAAAETPPRAGLAPPPDGMFAVEDAVFAMEIGAEFAMLCD